MLQDSFREEADLSEVQAQACTSRPKRLLDDLEARTAGICMHEDCEIIAIHPVHPVTVRRHAPLPNVALHDIVYEQIRDREVKTLSQIYYDVVSEYGKITIRWVQHTLVDLIKDRKIVLITAPGSRRRSKAIERLNGGYIRWTSPLLFDPEGPLFDQVEDLIKARQRHG